MGSGPGVIPEALLPWALAAYVAWLGVGLGLLGLGAGVPARLDLRDRATRVGLGVGVALALGYTVLTPGDDLRALGASEGLPRLVVAADLVSDGFTDAAFVVLIFLLPARPRACARSPTCSCPLARDRRARRPPHRGRHGERLGGRARAK